MASKLTIEAELNINGLTKGISTLPSFKMPHDWCHIAIGIEPKEVAAVIAFLASDDASFMTGTNSDFNLYTFGNPPTLSIAAIKAVSRR